MNPVVHYEMPYDDLATTTGADDNGPVKPGAINGGFYQKNPEWSAAYPSVVIAADDVEASGR